jgi:hypothetical protein
MSLDDIKQKLKDAEAKAEPKVDSILRRLADSPYTVGIVVVIVLAITAALFFIFR